MIYMGTIIKPAGNTDTEQREAIMVASDISSAEELLIENEKLIRIINMQDWVPADSREQYQGDFYMVDVLFYSEVTAKTDNIRYLVQADSFTEIEEICEEETGDSFEGILSIEMMPHDILGFNQ